MSAPLHSRRRLSFAAATAAATALAFAGAHAWGQAANAPPASSYVRPAGGALSADALLPPDQVPLKPAQIALLERTLADADSQGLESGDFGAAAADALLQSRDAGARQIGQRQLVAAVLRYAKAVHSGRLAGPDFITDWGMRPAPYDPGPDFARAAMQDQLAAWLDGLPPPYTGYDSLRQGLATYRTIAANGGWRPVPAGPEMKPGAIDVRAVALRARLAAEDPSVAATPPPQPPPAVAPPASSAPTSSAPAAAAPAPPRYDPDLVQAVMRAQKRYGLQDDGVVNAATLAALNTSVDRRIDQILANIERWRWLPPVLPVDRIQVNIAAAILTVFHSDTPTLSMRAVTGRPGDETPMLQSRVESIVFNPPWNVPSTIATKELWPKERANPGYFASHDFIVVPTGDGGSRLVQKAGPQAALGKIKFDFPNPYGVYLHDTPTQSTFSRFSRLSSHGCVRLQHPLILANALLQGDQTWTPETVDATLATGKTVRAALSQPVAVFLFYWTAYLGTDGMMNFRSDPYGWDATLMQRLRTPSGTV